MKRVILLISYILLIIGYFFAIGYSLMFIGMIDKMEIPIVLPNTVSYEKAKIELIVQDIGIIILIIFLFLLGFYLNSLYHRLSLKKKDTKKKEDVNSPFVLYLRSFVDDTTTKKGVSSFIDNRTEEEIVIDVFSDIAPVYAIGDPKDKKMPHGASRIYVSDEEWQSTVYELALKAELVLLRLGKTDSFWWEVEMVISNIPLNKIIFIVPYSDTFDNVAVLYKILIKHNIDIQNLGIHIDKKVRGSISSLVYFDCMNNSYTTTLEIRRFTGLFLSYDIILRKALSGLRARYGLSPCTKMSIAKARVLQTLIILYVLFIGFSNTFVDMTSLKYQLPYEFLKRCTDNPVYVQEHSANINGTNLTRCLLEATYGRFLLNDEEFLYLYMIELQSITKMKHDEVIHLCDEPWNSLLMVKKYIKESYNTYLSYMVKAANEAVSNKEILKDVIMSYKDMTYELPYWLHEVINQIEESELNEYESISLFSQTVLDHINDEDIVDVLKILLAQNINVSDN